MTEFNGLVEQRNGWRKQFEQGMTIRDMPQISVFESYEINRNSESWRLPTQIELLCEYILYLEEKGYD